MKPAALDVVAATLQDVVAALTKSQITAVDLLQQYLDRIDADNIEGLGLRAVLELAPRDLLVEQAKTLDDERKNGKTRSELHGIPILIKDSISTHPSMGMQTTAGTVVLEGSVVKRNAPIVDQMLEAGIIILGKANMTVMSNFYGNHPNGWSPRGGQTLSYLKPGMDPGGSSSGSAVGVSAGFCAASIGGETCGSIIAPALRAGLYGMKPTIGLVPCDEVIGVSARVDCLGPIGKSTWDVVAMLETIALPSRDFLKYAQAPYDDIATTPIRLGIHKAYVRPGDPPDKGADAFLKPEAEALWKEALSKLAPIVKADPADIPDVERLWQNGYPDAAPWLRGPNARLLETEMWEAVHEHLGRIENCKVRNLEELVQWNIDHPDLAFHDPKGEEQQQRLVVTLSRKGAKDESYHSALEVSAHVAQDMEALFKDKGIDVLAFPACLSCKAPTIASCGGYPIATVPIGQLSGGWPCAIHLMALKGQEEKLISAMATCENVFKFKPQRWSA